MAFARRYAVPSESGASGGSAIMWTALVPPIAMASLIDFFASAPPSVTTMTVPPFFSFCLTASSTPFMSKLLIFVAAPLSTGCPEGSARSSASSTALFTSTTMFNSRAPALARR